MNRYTASYKIAGKLHRAEEVTAQDVLHANSLFEAMYPEAELFKTSFLDVNRTPDNFKKFDITIVHENMDRYKANYWIDGKVHRAEEVAALDIAHAASQFETMYPNAESFKTYLYDINTTADGFKKFDIYIVWQSVDKDYGMFLQKQRQHFQT